MWVPCLRFVGATLLSATVVSERTRSLWQDDFEKYGLEILVKFREETELAALNGRRQSGGESSVSTMCFILALHKLSDVRPCPPPRHPCTHLLTARARSERLYTPPPTYSSPYRSPLL